jgi:hypothetical protein
MSFVFSFYHMSTAILLNPICAGHSGDPSPGTGFVPVLCIGYCFVVCTRYSFSLHLASLLSIYWLLCVPFIFKSNILSTKSGDQCQW